MAGADEALFSHTAYDKAQTTKALLPTVWSPQL